MSYATTVTFVNARRSCTDSCGPAGHSGQMTSLVHRVRSTGPLISRIVAALFGGYALAALSSVAVLALPHQQAPGRAHRHAGELCDLRRCRDLGLCGAQRAEGLGGPAHRGRGVVAAGVVCS